MEFVTPLRVAGSSGLVCDQLKKGLNVQRWEWEDMSVCKTW